jgi:hypothetical protein
LVEGAALLRFTERLIHAALQELEEMLASK